MADDRERTFERIRGAKLLIDAMGRTSREGDERKIAEFMVFMSIIEGVELTRYEAREMLGL